MAYSCRSISPAGSDERADPVPPGVVPHQVAIDRVELGGKRARIGQPVGPGPDRSARVEMLNDDGRFSCRYRIGGNIPDHHGTGSDNAVFADPDPLANDGAVTDPNVLPDVDRNRFPYGRLRSYRSCQSESAHKDPVGQHAAVPDLDLRGCTDPYSGTDQTAVPIAIRPSFRSDQTVSLTFLSGGDNCAVIPRATGPEDLHARAS